MRSGLYRLKQRECLLALEILCRGDLNFCVVANYYKLKKENVCWPQKALICRRGLNFCVRTCYKLRKSECLLALSMLCRGDLNVCVDPMMIATSSTEDGVKCVCMCVCGCGCRCVCVCVGGGVKEEGK